MKRLGNLYEKITSLANLQLADKKGQQGKAGQYGVILHNCNAGGKNAEEQRSTSDTD